MSGLNDLGLSCCGDRLSVGKVCLIGLRDLLNVGLDVVLQAWLECL